MSDTAELAVDDVAARGDRYCGAAGQASPSPTAPSSALSAGA